MGKRKAERKEEESRLALGEGGRGGGDWLAVWRIRLLWLMWHVIYTVNDP